MKAVKAFIEPFESPQRSVGIKILVNGFSSSGIGEIFKKFLRTPFLQKRCYILSLHEQSFQTGCKYKNKYENRDLSKQF